MTKFYHFNFNVLDLERSLAFYRDALGLEPVREKEAADGSFKLVFLGEKFSGFPVATATYTPALCSVRRRDAIPG